MIRLRQSCLIIALLWASTALSAADNTWEPLPVTPADGLPFWIVPTGDPDVLYSDGLHGLQRSDDGGRHWQLLSAPVYGFPVVDPGDPATVFLPAEGLLLRSADGGRSWAVAFREAGLVVPTLLISRKFDGRAYLANGTALWRSEDGGVTFENWGVLPGASAASVLSLAEAADGALYLRRAAPCGRFGCGEEWGVYRSDDQGRNWVTVEEPSPGRIRIELVEPDARRPATVYFLRTRGGSGSELERSDDRGVTRQPVATPEPISAFALFADPAAPDTLYLYNSYQLFRSADGGATWQQRVLPTAPDLVESNLALGAGGQVYLYDLRYFATPPASLARSFASHDGGATWTAVEVEGSFQDYIEETAVSGPDGVLYTAVIGSRGGLLRSADGGDSWEPRTGAPRVFDDLTGDPLDGDTLYLSGGFEGDYGLFRSRDGGRSFQLMVETDPFVPDLVAYPVGGVTHLAAAIGHDTLARSADGGSTWVVTQPRDNFGSQLEFDNLAWDGQALYGSSGNKLYGSADGGTTWTYRDDGAADLAGGGGILARLDFTNLALQSTTTGGPPWFSYPLPRLADAGYPWQLEVDGRGQLYVFSDGGVMLRSRDRGRTWQALSQDLHLSRLQHLVFDPRDADTLYVGGTSGLFRGHFPGQPLALLRGRFEARLFWRTSPAAAWSEAPGGSITDQSGVFSPFSRERAEVEVQILDGRPLSGTFWVFVASMTDVELELEVRDRVQGTVWRHHQPAGPPRSVAEFAAFPQPPQPTGGSLPQPFSADLAKEERVVAGLGRFAVRVTRPNPAGGPPLAVRGSLIFGETAAFAFFDPESADLLVNLIDGRALNGKYWVYGGSLTDQEFDVTIEDLATRTVVWTYHHEYGTFAGFTDSNAF